MRPSFSGARGRVAATGDEPGHSTGLLAQLGALLLACVTLAAPAPAEENETTLVLEEDFGAACVGWSMRDWTNPFRPGVRPDESVVCLEEGLMKVYLGRGMLGINKSDLYHGKVVSRPLELYADFVVDFVMKWDRKTASTMMEVLVRLHSRSIGVALAGFGGRGAGASVLGNGLRGAGKVPLAGEAKVRFQRKNGEIRVFWNDKLLGGREALHPVTSVSFTVKTYHTRRVEGSYAALDLLRVRLPKPSVSLVPRGEAEGSPNLVVGGDFEQKAKGAPGAELDQVMLETEGLKGAGIGSLLGWETDVDGVQRIWESSESLSGTKSARPVIEEENPGPEKPAARTPLTGRCLKLEIKGKKGISFSSNLFPLEPGAEYEFSCHTRVETPGINTTALPVCTIQGFSKYASPVTALCRPAVDRGVNNWNWKETRARFVVKSPKVVSGEVTFAARRAGEEGAALFDNVVIRKLTQREQDKTSTATLRENLVSLQEDLTRTRCKHETTLDVLGFDLDATKGKPEHPALAAKVREFAALKEEIEGLGPSAKKLYWTSAETMQFFDRVTEEQITEVRSDVEAFQDKVEEFRNRLRGREIQLREELVALRPPRKRKAFKDNREWARNRFHLYWQNAMGLDPPGFEDAFRYMGEMGTTVLQTGLPRPGPYWKCGTRDECTRHLLSLADQEGMKIFGCYRPRVSPHPSGREAIRNGIKAWFDALGDHPAVGGLEFDEICFGACPCEECRIEFRKYLKAKYSTKELVELGILAERTEHIVLDEIMEEDEGGDRLLGDAGEKPPAPVDVESTGPIYDVDKLFPPEPEDRAKKRVLWMEHREFIAHLFEEGCKDAFDYAHSLKSDAIMLPLLSLGPIHNAPFTASLARVSTLGDMIAIDPYYDGIPEEAFFCDLMRANAKGPALITVGTGMPYIRGNARSLKNDLCICFAHADGMYVFDWIYVFKQRPYVTNNAEPYWTRWWSGAWEHVWATYRKAHKIEEYLIRTKSPATVAMLYSERSTSVLDYREVGVSMGSHYGRQQMGLYCLLMQTHIQEDPIFAEGLTREKLNQYTVLLVQNAVALTPGQEELIRAWVRDGGQLIVTASTSILDRWGRRQEDYRLAEVFGVKYLRTERAGDAPTFGESPKVSYYKRGLYDIVEPTTGTVRAKWATGPPAVVTNSFGKGRCVFISASDLGRAYSGKARPRMTDRIPVHKTFFPGIRELISTLILEGLSARGKEPLFFVENCPDEVETLIRVQNIGGVLRRMLHLTNFSFAEPIQGVAIELPVSEGEELRLFYPTDNAPVEAKRKGNRLAFTVRDFEVHEVIVIERKE